MDFTETKKVREHNSQEFVKDFRRLRSFVMLSSQGEYYEILKSKLWESAKRGPITYRLTDRVYQIKRISMLII